MLDIFSTIWSYIGVIISYAMFIPAGLAIASMTGLLPLKLPPLIAVAIVAVSCTLGGHGIGVKRGGDVERAKWSAAVKLATQQREAEKSQAANRLQELQNKVDDQELEIIRRQEEADVDLQESITTLPAEARKCFDERIPDNVLRNIR